MNDLRFIINNLELVRKRLSARPNFNLQELDKVVLLARERSECLTAIQTLEAQRNTLSTKISTLKAKGETVDALIAEVTAIKQQIVSQQVSVNNAVLDLDELMLTIPNLPAEDTPLGASDGDNVELRRQVYGASLESDFKVKPHYEIATERKLVDFASTVRMSGTRFWSYSGRGAQLLRAVQNFMLDTHIKAGYLEYNPPVIVNEAALIATGQLPKFREEVFQLSDRNAFLIPTAEVPLTNLFADQILDLKTPIKLTAYTPCFRAEAGAGGRDTRGLIRGHQFHKVEIVKIVRQEEAEAEYAEALSAVRQILELLKLPYREVRLCGGDLGFSSMKTIDFEVWLPSEGKFREISSVSLFGTFQTLRAQIRYRDEVRGNVPAVTINGSGLAIDRTIAAILENYQQRDGTIKIPDVLIPYLGIKAI